MVSDNKPSSICGFLMKPQAYLIALLLSIAAYLPAHAEVYKWKDKEGGLHYSEHPPANVKYETFTPRYAAPVNSPTAEPNSEPQSDPKTLDQKSDQEKEQQRQAENAKIRLQNCFIAQKRLDDYESASRINIKNPDGTVQRLTEEERQSRINESRELIKKYCD